MNDISDLFSSVAPVAAHEPSAAVLDADVARGQLALARARRQRRSRGALAGATTLAAAAAVAVLVAGQSRGSSPTPGAAPRGTAPSATSAPNATVAPTAPPAKVLPVQLVAYTGRQLAGFTVDRVPSGWRLSASTQYALTIDPQGDTNNDPDVFEGKLTVLLQSQSVSGLPNGQPVTVNGQPGVVTNEGGQALTYNDGHGHTVVVQAPGQLAWSNAQIVSFAEGVHVTGSALAGVG